MWKMGGGGELKQIVVILVRLLTKYFEKEWDMLQNGML